eukprot:TRINITY_DN11832_c0_g1_i1.p1 TRINITY_DN11832_c0_g1~~TRINITY_DN11832_c0_g1_i1.p1  ORF type:complete len:393 (+),score=70.27 TRINITY_DN11832_c0_g1_i1:125-1180(+)
MENSLYVFEAGVGIAFIFISLMTWLVSLSVRADGSHSLFFYVFSVFAFTAMVDLDIGFTLDQVVMPWTNFYLNKGEPYLKSSYGSAINWWDGTFHYSLYLYMIWSMMERRNYRWAGFIWAGSIMNSMLVFIPGNIVGKFGGEIKESILLNIPYATFPVLFAIREWRKPSPAKLVRYIGKTVRRGTVLFVVDCVLIGWLLFATALAFFRGFIVLGSPLKQAQSWVRDYEPILSDEAKWPQMQVLLHLYFFVPFYLYAIWALLKPSGKQHFTDLAALHLGAALQGQWSYIFPAVHQVPGALSTYPRGIWTPIPAAGKDIFYQINLSLVIVPLILFLRASWVDQAYWAKKQNKK